MTAYSGDRKKKKASRAESVEAAAFVESPGAKLQKARQAKNIDIQAAAEQLNLKQSVVKALEADDYRGLPNATFVKGYLRNYAKFVDISGDELMRLYEQSLGEGTTEESKPLPPKRRPGHISLKSASLALLVILIGAAVAWYWKTIHLESGRTPEFAKPDTQLVKEPAVIGLSDMSDTDSHSRAAVIDGHASEEGSAIIRGVDEQLSLNKPADSTTNAQVVPSKARPETQVAAREQQSDLNSVAADTGVKVAPLKEKTPFVESLVALAAAARGSSEQVAENAVMTEEDILNDEPALAEKLGRLDMEFTDECWVEVKDGFNKLIYANLKVGGSKLSLEGQPPFEVKFGNGKAVTLSFNGEPFPVVYSSSTNVARLSIGDQ